MKSRPDQSSVPDDPANDSSLNARVAAILVLYRPKLDLLERLICSVAEQVDWICVIDNTPNPDAELSGFLKRYEARFSYFPMGENLGIATAQNVGIRKCLNASYSHLLLLDQDTALPAGALAALLAAERSLVKSGKQVAAVGPAFVDEKNGKRSCAVHHQFFRIKRIPIHASEANPVETDFLIASGSLIRTSIMQRVGLMRDELFIDWVDAEWGLRARSLGYANYIVPGIVMKHSIGDLVANIFGREINLHDAARNYYIVRNAAYLLKERRMGWRWRTGSFLLIPKLILVRSWLSPHRWESFKQLVRAAYEGTLGTMRKFPAI
jgi:rhamnosyltransferase